MTQLPVLAAIFLAVLLLAFSVVNYVSSKREVRRNIARIKSTTSGRKQYQQRQLDELLSEENETARYFFEVLRNDAPDSLRPRLIRAGFFSRRAPMVFNLIRSLVAVAVFVLIWVGTYLLSSSVRPMVVLMFAVAFSGAVFILANVVLDNLGKRREREYRKLFPDFMDLLIVCVDAGLGIDAALDRVSREFLVTNPDFGTHLSIIVLELRAGRPIHEALSNFATQVNLEEARSLATLFRQSIELGSSVGKTLRVFSAEMRTLRIVRAEEKANALPVKMLFPLAVFMFPVNLVIVLVPVLIGILKMFMTLSPPG
ncbi:type II secretion system F family protein [Aliiroseovarius crassostreae]|uniref:type II secretion system F family protein n=1 Tax=Aliiroseovarius crassostreae TaxID=154981 RepID=UPI0022080A89|nr:type II secretion system F family protein [Aliiroseovarius crassostreae]UWP87839.1 type II secretion system F family protein [Aliiroseovarius crassostreae]UWP90992.1 type II secretion system F family protein [Aliiroseovarius crassostreae]UWP97304.1 type II secretion system F family protein [Aliiroseovarius crassostreae]UWQ00459.1 type II secretion system F family protein [Aliiroseovarius crassostreae]